MRRMSMIMFVLALAAPAVAQIPFGQPFDLAVGADATVGGLRIGFTEVPSDSRCPLGAWCFWEGDAATSLWLLRPGAPAEDFVLHTTTNFGMETSHDFGDVTVALLAVVPYPVLDQPIDPATYVVTLVATENGVGVAPLTWSALKASYR